MTILYFIILFIYKVNCQTNVPILNTNDLNAIFKQSDYLLLYFFEDECKQCDLVNFVYNDTVSHLNSQNHNISFGKVNCTNNSEINIRFDIVTLPTIRLVNVAQDLYYDYIGDWKSTKVANFVLGHLRKGVVNITSFQSLPNNNYTHLVICGEPDRLEKLNIKIKEIISARENIDFYQIEGEELRNLMNCSRNQSELFMINPSDYRIMKFNEKFSSEKLEEWIDVYTLPILLELNEDNFEAAIQLQKPLFFFITDNEETPLIQNIKKSIYNQAKEHRGKAIFLNSKNNTFFINRFLINNNDRGTLPVIFSLVPDKEGSILKYVYDQSILKEETMNQWILNVINNKTMKYIKSEDIPENNLDGSLVIVVGKTFEEIVLNNNKDVLLEISSTWDDESKKLDVKFKRIAQKLRKNQNLIVARMEGTKNEYEDVQMTNLPTVYLFKGGNLTGIEKLNNRFKFEGKFNASSIIDFARNNSFYEINQVEMVPNELLIEQEELVLELSDILTKDLKEEKEKPLYNFDEIEKFLESNNTLDSSTFELKEEDLIEDDQEEIEYEKRKKLREAYDARFEEL